MARGRMLSKSLSTSVKRGRLHDTLGPLAEFAQALYPLLVAHADDFGLESGDTYTVKHLIDPTSPRTEAEFDHALNGLAAVGLISRQLLADGRTVLAITDFDAHQVGLHKRTRSRFGNFPEIPGDTHLIELNRTELKGTELKGRSTSRTRREFDPIPRQAVENVKVIAQVIIADLLPLGLDSLDLPEAVKRRCAELHIAYDATTIRKALDVVHHRKLHGDA